LVWGHSLISEELLPLVFTAEVTGAASKNTLRNHLLQEGPQDCYPGPFFGREEEKSPLEPMSQKRRSAVRRE
jgi:hypothetical protein